jgi:L-asparaginase/Glu-tRNA(Gln) amidotransferase subunit D
MGTDTMAYAASALSFIFENLGKTVSHRPESDWSVMCLYSDSWFVGNSPKVVLTGSMIPFCIPYNDARRNLIVSLLIAANVEIPEVCIFFNSSLFRGNRATKINNFGYAPLLPTNN